MPWDRASRAGDLQHLRNPVLKAGSYSVQYGVLLVAGKTLVWVQFRIIGWAESTLEDKQSFDKTS